MSQVMDQPLIQDSYSETTISSATPKVETQINEVSETVIMKAAPNQFLHSQRTDDDENVTSPLYQARFHKTRKGVFGSSFKCMQNFRFASFISLSPIVWLSLLVHGPLYFLKYATQWSAWFTVAAFYLMWKSANIDQKLEMQFS